MKWLEKNISLIVIVLLIFSAAAPILLSLNSFSKIFNLSNSGGIGEAVNGMTAPFLNLITIFLIFMTYQSQKKELEETRAEFISQNQTLKKQRFENTFFHLLNLYNEIVDKLSLMKANKRKFFEAAYNALQKNENSDLTIEYETEEDNWNAIQDGYNHFNENFASHLSHYFRNLYHIYKYIYLTDLISDDEKTFYANIVRAQLSDYELALIFYNMLVKDLGYPKFKFLDQEYDILQNLDEDLLFHDSHWNFFQNKTVDDPFKKKS